MKAEDLMIGDWVVEHDHGYNSDGSTWESDKTTRITAINGYGVDTKRNYHLRYDEIEPIPLTPEILLKNGFENDFYEDVSVADYHKIRVEGYSLKGKVDDWDDFLITFCNGNVNVVTDFHGEFRGEIRYVHTFQHALRLCKIDLEIKL